MTATYSHAVQRTALDLRTGDVPALLRQPGGFHTLRAALSEMRAAFPPRPDTADAPPWVLCPGLPRGSIGWQTGQGLAALHRFAAWYGGQTAATRAALRSRCPEPEGWHGFYDSLT